MADILQHRKGTRAGNDLLTGALAELSVDVDSKALRVHDGAKAGGYELGMAQANGMADLRTHTPTVGARRYLTHHTTQGDGGHGVFRAVTGAVAGIHVDNNGTIIVPTGGNGSMAWVREYNMLNIAHFGVVGDGIIDDAPFFLAASLIENTVLVPAPQVTYTFNLDVLPIDCIFITYEKSIAQQGIGKVYIQNNAGKLDKLTYGTRDTSVVHSASAGNGSNRRTNVMGIVNVQDVSTYSGRDSVASFSENTAQATIISDAATTFTATTVSSTAFTASIFAKLRKGMLIDVANGAGVGIKATGTILSWTGTTITVDTAWYKVDDISPSTNIAVTPLNGSMIHINPSTKVWAHNAVLTIPAASHATAGAGFELDLLPNKLGTGAGTTGFDAVGMGVEDVYSGFMSRGNLSRGYEARAKVYGYTANFGTGHSEVGYWAKTDKTLAGSRYNFLADTGKENYRSQAGIYGLRSVGDTTAISIEDPTLAAFQILKAGAIKIKINAIGQFTAVTGAIQTLAVSGNIGAAYIIQCVGNITATLPTPVGNTGKMFYIRAYGTPTLATVSGLINGAATYTMTVGQGVTVFSDGSNWVV